MADKSTSTVELKIETLFIDGDTRTFNLKNPKADLTNSDIATLNTFMQDNNIIIGDKYGGRFGKITAATRINKSVVTLDLNDNT